MNWLRFPPQQDSVTQCCLFETVGALERLATIVIPLILTSMPVQSPQFTVTLCALVVVLAAVQSVFGVGLLVFGTPTLLLLGVPFEDVLAYLLPCSITVSTLQIATSGGLTLTPIRRKFLFLTAPAVLVGTLLVLGLGKGADLKPFVGAMLLVTAAVRVVGPVRVVVNQFIERRLGFFALALGLLHGLTNLGGGVLTSIVSAVHQDKSEVRRHIAFCYGMMAMIQLTTLLITTSVQVQPLLWVTLPVLAISSFTIVGRVLFRLAGQTAYQNLLTALIACFGVLLLFPPA
ncbi:MAG: TSUP family transporter [Nocardioidaceae bacterium]